MSESTTTRRPSRPSRLDEAEAKRNEEASPEGKASPVAEGTEAPSTDAEVKSTETVPETQQPVPGGPEVRIDEDGDAEVALEDVMSRSSKFSKHFTRIDSAREATLRGKAKQMATETEETGKTLIEELRGAAYAKGYGFRGKVIKVQGKFFVQYAVPNKREKKDVRP